ncbi:hypothetical protein Ancab_009741 [Ancistrocladus abbreviatus]
MTFVLDHTRCVPILLDLRKEMKGAVEGFMPFKQSKIEAFARGIKSLSHSLQFQFAALIAESNKAAERSSTQSFTSKNMAQGSSSKQQQTLNPDENAEAGDDGGVDRDEIVVAIVDEEVGVECNGGKVVNAAGAIGEVAKDKAPDNADEGLEDVGENKRAHQEVPWELESEL